MNRGLYEIFHRLLLTLNILINKRQFSISLFLEAT